MRTLNCSGDSFSFVSYILATVRTQSLASQFKSANLVWAISCSFSTVMVPIMSMPQQLLHHRMTQNNATISMHCKNNSHAARPALPEPFAAPAAWTQTFSLSLKLHGIQSWSKLQCHSQLRLVQKCCCQWSFELNLEALVTHDLGKTGTVRGDSLPLGFGKRSSPSCMNNARTGFTNLPQGYVNVLL